MSLVLVDEIDTVMHDHESSVYATKWNGQAFAAELPVDALDGGISGAVVGTIDHLESAVDADGRPFAVWSATDQAGLRIGARGNAEQIQHVYYVNANLASGGRFTTAAGSAANDGLSANSPKSSIQDILDLYTIVSGDVILVDSGAADGPVPDYEGFTLTAAQAGLRIVGSAGNRPNFVGQIVLDQAVDVVLQGLGFSAGVLISGGSHMTLVANRWRNVGLAIDGGSAIDIVHNEFQDAGSAVIVRGGATGIIVEHNSIRGGNSGIVVTGNATVTLRDNSILQAVAGVLLSGAGSGRISGNNIAQAHVGISVNAPFAGIIDTNDIHDSATGIASNVPTALSVNRIHDNTVGVSVEGELSLAPFSFVGQIEPNEIFDNGVGVQLNGQLSGQHIYRNLTGVTGSGFVGRDDLENANVIENNSTGVNVSGVVHFNRIAANEIGIVAHDGELIANNLVYRNRTVGVSANGVNDVQLLNNTFFAPTGDNVRIEGGARNLEIRNNTLWAQGGYDIFVADDSHTGFFSDYNDLHSSGTGILVHWFRDFVDILDWQVELGEFDLHSIGRTEVNPSWSQPRFVDLAGNDFSVYEPLAGQRGSSPTIAAGDPLTDVGLSAAYVNLLQNPGFEAGLMGWAVSSGSSASAGAPTAFAGVNHYASANPLVGFAQQAVDLLAAGFSSAQLDSQTLRAAFGGRIRSAGSTPHDLAELSLTFLDGAGVVLGEVQIQVKNPEDYWLLAGGRDLLPVGTRRIQFSYRGIMPDGSVGQIYLDDAFLYLLPEDAEHDAGAYGNTAIDDSHATAPRLALRSPDLYVDWEAAKPRTILWGSYANAAGANVLIDLYQDGPRGPQFVTTLGSATADDGTFNWIPADSGIAPGTYGLRIHISLVGNRAVFDRSTEPFTVPESTDTFYVNDASAEDDQYTSAVGNNRNTGKLSSAPKPDLATILRDYSLGANQTVYVDTGDYRQFIPLVISGLTDLGDDQGFLVTGPTGVGSQGIERRATFRFIDPTVVRPLVEVNDASFVTLANLSLLDAQMGVWLHNNSTQFVGTGLTLAHATLDGLRAETGASVASLSNLQVFANGGHGINISGGTGTIAGSQIYDNRLSGIVLVNPGQAALEDNDVYGNALGLYGVAAVSITNASALTTIFGNTDLAQQRGNRVHDNGFAGVYASGNVVVAGNSVYGHDADGAYGIHSDGSGAGSLQHGVQ